MCRFIRAVSLVAVAVVGAAYAQSGPQWQNLYPNYGGLAFGEGRFVAVSADGVIRTSASGIGEWTQIYPGAASTLYTVAYGGGMFIATQSSVNVLHSGNGLDWGQSWVGANMPCRHMTHGESGFLCVSSEGYMSFDTRDWDSFDRDVSGLAHAAYGAGVYVMVGNNIMSSANAIEFTQRLSTPGGAGAVAYGNDMFVAIGNAGTTVYTSPDGISWASASANAPAGMADMTFADGKFVTVGAAGRAGVSTNGTSWTSAVLNESDNFRAVKHGNGTFVALGERGSVYTSADGTTWNKQAAGQRPMTYRHIVHGGSVFVAVGDSGLAVSRDGREWARKNAGKNLQNVTYGAGRFVVVGDSGAIFSSADGETWENHGADIESSTMLTSVAFGNNMFIAAGRTTTGVSGSGAGVYTSPNGKDWTDQRAIITGWTGQYPTVMAFGNGRFLAAGSSLGSMRLSSDADGRYWSPVSLPTTVADRRISAITYAEDKFIALGTSAGQPALLLTSTDGTNWTTIYTQQTGVRSATSANGWYVLAAPEGNIYASQNGQQWFLQRKATNRDLHTVYFGNNTLLAAGARGVMLYSSENPIPVRHPAASRTLRNLCGMTVDNSKKTPAVTLSFTPEKPGTMAVYSLTGRQICKARVSAGQKTVLLPERLPTNGSVIIRYVGGDGRVAVKRVQMVR